ncbi:glycosyltransferase [Proteus terrae]|uniref:glycosyltransferase n=1 Tax=Proteus terrae TaxID=1574161 RepID=UPI0013DEE7A5|nr:glycosyltransferase [Proteus terrae]QIF96596.1 glycosyltransferase [Proteus terrae subsp. cibarius]
MKKVLIIGFNLGGFGGMETVFNKSIGILNSHGISTEFIFFNENNNQVSDEWLTGHRYRRLSSKIKNTKLRRVGYAVQLAKVIRKERPDIIISYDTVCCYIANLARKITRSNVIIYSWIHFSLHNLYKSIYLHKADYHLSISSGITRQMTDIGIEKDKIFTIYNPVGESNITITRDKNVRFLYVGRLISDEPKNINELFYALSKLKGNWILDIIGDGKDAEYLRHLALELNIISNINWHGWKKNAWKYIKENIKYTSALVLTSTNEGFPMVLCEASSHGVFCISSNCSTGPEDIIIPESNGLLYPVRDMTSLANHLQSIVNGRLLPSHNEIKNTITKFNDANFANRLLSALKLN